MNRCAYMIVTEIGYFISHDTLRADINEAIEYFKSKYKFEKIIDIIKEPYLQLENELEDIYNNDNIKSKTKTKLFSVYII